MYSCIKACLPLKKIEVALMTSPFKVKSKTKAEFLSQTLQESPRKHKLRTQLENSKKETRELKRKIDASSEEIEKFGSELESVTNKYEQNIRILARAEQQYGAIIERLVQERNMNIKLSHIQVVSYWVPWQQCHMQH